MGVSGVGLGLRWEFLDELLAREALPIDFLEISPENYMNRGGYYPAAMERAASRYPIVTHGLTLSMGGTDAFDQNYLRDLAAFVAQVKSPWHSDHLCFGSADGRVLHDLLPIRFTDEAVTRTAERISRARDALRVPLAVENISFYFHPGKKEMSEPEFIAKLCDKADCGLMLDVNNAYVNAQNFGFDVDAWMNTVPLDRVVQMHVAGHDWFDEEGGSLPAQTSRRPQKGEVIVDTHGADVCDPVLALLGRVLTKTGPVPVLLERDQEMPTLDGLIAEIAKIKAIWTESTRAFSPRGA